MKISKQEVDHVAKLARLELSEQEQEKLTDQLSNILTYVEKLNELDTTGVEPTAHVLDIKNVMREDAGAPSLPRSSCHSETSRGPAHRCAYPHEPHPNLALSPTVA